MCIPLEWRVYPIQTQKIPILGKEKRRKGVNVSEIEIGCNKSVNIEISWHDAFLE